MICLKSDPDSISLAADELKKGRVIIIPTDTVYGFSGIVDDAFKTDLAIRQLKGRAEDKPFIQLLSSPADLELYTDDEIPSWLLDLWPGALTIIVSNKEGSTTAFRCPADPWLLSVLQKTGKPVYSTSANKSGQTQINDPEYLEKLFGPDILIVDGGVIENGLASTLVVPVKNESGFIKVKVLRQGPVEIPDEYRVN